MTEKEKRDNGELYIPSKDSKLLSELRKAKELCMKYNCISGEGAFEKRKSILKELLGKCTSNIAIEPNFYCDYGYQIEIGDNFYANHNLVILDPAKVFIGDNVFIGPNVGIYTAAHPIQAETRNKGLEYAKSITIGNNVWIGGNAVILPGVEIGDNCIIGAGSVVTKSIEKNSLAVGNPCRVIKKIE